MNNKTFILRVTALWAFNEAFLGGILHSVKLPFTGMVLAAFAIICIILIGSVDPNAILKALLLVAIVKFTLSPQTPLTAYIAVGFQGLTGYLILRPKSFFLIKCILFAALAMIQTALQKAIVLTLVYSSQFWSAINKLLDSLLKDFGIKDHNYAFIILSIYVFIHVIAGIFAAVFAYRFSKIHAVNRKDEASGGKILTQNEIATFLQKKKKKHLKIVPLILLLFAILYALKYFAIIPADSVQNDIIQIIIRGALILLIWSYFVAPIITTIFFRWLTKKRTAFKDEIAVLLTFTPEIKEIVNKSWRDSKSLNIFVRIPHFISESFRVFLLKEN